MSQEYLEDKIDRFLKNSRNLGELITTITRRSMETTNICTVDENNCRRMEEKERTRFIVKELQSCGVTREESERLAQSILTVGAERTQSTQIDIGNMVDIQIKAEEIKKIRLPEAYNLLQAYRRISYNLDEGGYTWDKFFRREDEEPEKERLYRDAMNPTLRSDLRRKGIRLFLNHTYIYLDAILAKDINFLINNLNQLFSNDEFTSRISLIFGSLDQNGNPTTQYATEKEIDTIWRIIHGCIKNAILYCHASEITHFTVHERSRDRITKRDIVVNYEELKLKWNLQY